MKGGVDRAARAFWLCRVPELGCLVDLGLGSVERGELVAEDEQLDVFGIRYRARNFQVTVCDKVLGTHRHAQARWARSAGRQ
jgi:hypothetical protein